MMPEGERPHPRRTYRRGIGLEDTADNLAVRQHVVIVVPLTAWAGRRGALEDQFWAATVIISRGLFGGSLCTSLRPKGLFGSTRASDLIKVHPVVL
jgi:hypothetical protein